MADEAPESTAPVTEPNTTAPVEDDVEKQAFLDRLSKESGKRKEAEQALKDAMARLEKLESVGLSETEQERKARERAERERDELRTERDQFAKDAQRSRAESWVTAAANAAGFEDSEDAVLRVTLDDVESLEDAERAVKRLAKAKPRLLKAETPTLPGRVLKNGRTDEPVTAPQTAEAEMLAEGLRRFASR